MRKPGYVPVLRASEKMLLHLLRLCGALSKAELARMSGMSAQGTSIIVERLLDLELVRKGEKKRGRVGQPSTPITLNPGGALSIGVFVERNRARLVVTDFEGAIRAERTLAYQDVHDASVPRRIFDAALDLPEASGPESWDRLAGIGVAANETLLEHFCASAPGSGRASLARRLEELYDVPAYCLTGIRAACIAELVMGPARAGGSMLYFDQCEALTTGIVLEGRLIGPEDQLSSALHSLPVPERRDATVGDYASLAPLRRRVKARGHDFDAQAACDFAETRDVFDDWKAGAVRALALAIHAASATVAVDRAMIASRLHRPSLTRLVGELRRAVKVGTRSCIRTPEVSMETVTPHPGARGAAMMPLLKIFGASEAGRPALPQRPDVA